MFFRCARRSFLVAVVLWTCSISAAFAPKPSAEQLHGQLEVLWIDLMSEDELVAGRAILTLAALRDDAVEFLAEKMQPLQLTKERCKVLLLQLGGDDEKAARAAFDELCYCDPRLALNQRELCEELLKPLISRRLAAVLCDLPFDFFCFDTWHWHSPDNKILRFNCGAIRDRDTPIGVEKIGTSQKKMRWSRAVRAISVLESLDTPKARAILARMAEGHPDAGPTKAAKEAVARLQSHP
jgi:hypothetical protein